MIPRKLADFGNLTKAEATLRDGVGSGRVVMLGDGSLPGAGAGPDRQIRASFLRYLILGGCDACRPSEKGVRVQGALIVDDWHGSEETTGLDLEGCRVGADLVLSICRFPSLVLLRGAKMRTVNFHSCALGQGLTADRISTTGGVFLHDAQVDGPAQFSGATLGGRLDLHGAKLRNTEPVSLHCDGLKTTGDVYLDSSNVVGAIRLLGATLNGNLDCQGMMLRHARGRALIADRLDASGNVFLNRAEVDGEIRLQGATLGGTLVCEVAKFRNSGGFALNADGLKVSGDVSFKGARVDGAIRMLGAKLDGDLVCDSIKLRNAGGFALSAVGARVEGILFLRKGAEITGGVDLGAAHFGTITDDPACWPKPGNLVLDRCTYGAFTGAGISAADRIRWLALQDPSRFGNEFWPQPWEQCAKVLREMGHRGDARAVLINRERRQREWARKDLGKAYFGFRWFIDEMIFSLLTGYGHQPIRAIGALVFLWMLGFWIFAGVAIHGDIKPNAERVLRSAEWVLCGADAGTPVALAGRETANGLRQPGETQPACFEREPQGAAYPRFNAAIYSLDTLLPIVDLEVQGNWIPDERSPFGMIARWYLWAHIMLGWALSLLAVAGFTGLIRGDK